MALRHINLVLFGAPGVGKGTYGKLIQKHYGFPTFSMGDYFRKIINTSDVHPDEESETVSQLRETLRKGHFVSDEMAMNVIREARFGEHKNTEVLILDGMPRTVL